MVASCSFSLELCTFRNGAGLKGPEEKGGGCQVEQRGEGGGALPARWTREEGGRGLTCSRACSWWPVVPPVVMAVGKGGGYTCKH